MNHVIWLLLVSCAAAAGSPAAGAERGEQSSPTVLPRANFKPGPEYADESRMFQGIPAIERAPNGRLWAAWYGGGVTEDKHNYILLDSSGDDGRTWRRMLILDPDRDGPVRAFDPCLWHDPEGKLWLFWAQRAGGQKPELLAITTSDSGNAAGAWSEPRRICEGIMMNKPTVGSGGRWLLPVALWSEEDSARVVASSDHGATFAQIGAARIPKKEERNCDEHMLVQRKDGALWLLVRTRYGIGESVSTDEGKTWPDVVPAKIPHPVSRFFVRRLATGRLLLVRHNPPEAPPKVRSNLTAFLSDDDGRTWKGGLLLDERRSVSYPDGIQAADGLIHVIYDFERQRDKEILMATFREEDVLAGSVASPGGRLRVRINKAAGVNPSASKGAVRSANADGAALLQGPSPEIESGEGEADMLRPGAKLFLDRRYTAQEVPEAFLGRKFVRFKITGGRAVCRAPGVIYILTPSAGRQKDSLAGALVKRGFTKAAVPEFMIFSGDANISSVFQKQVEKDEVIEFDKWGVLVLAGAAARRE